MNEKKKKSPIRIIATILIILVALVGIVFLGARLYFRIPVSDYYSASEKAFEIPGLSDGFIAQGLCYAEGSFYVTGYMGDKSASPIYIIDKASGMLTKTLYLANENGEAYTGHCGGMSVRAPFVYVAGGKGIYVFDLDTLKNAEDFSSISAIGYFSTGQGDSDDVGVAFTTIKDDQIIIGEFYRAENYPTADSHKFTTPAGDYNQALALIYDFSTDTDSQFGINPMPKAAYSLPDLVQGMVHKNGQLYLSTSYGAAFSHILIYDEAKMSQGTLNYLGNKIPLFYCDSAALADDLKIAPMSEEICFVDDHLYVMCESASNKYFFGKLTSAKWCYSTDINKMSK